MKDNNALVYLKKKDNHEYLYARIQLNNGQVVDLPISLSFPNKKLLYKIKINLKG